MTNVTLTSKITIGPNVEVIIPVGPSPEQWRQDPSNEKDAPLEVPLQSSTLLPGTIVSVDF
jgi:hypothetical protein